MAKRIVLAVVATCLCGAGPARAATLAQLVAGATIETGALTFDSFSYTGYSGGPAATAITVTAAGFGSSGGLQFAGQFTGTTFVQAMINYRVTAKNNGSIFDADLAGNPAGGNNGFAFVDESFSSGLTPLSVFSQPGGVVTADSATFSSPRTSLTVHTQIRLNGSVSSPSTVSQFVQLFGATPFQGDFDLDGDVDGGDFLVWQRGVGLTGSSLRNRGDANGDGSVNGADLLIWRNEFGDAAVAASSAAPVPEPAGAGLAAGLCGAVGAASARRRHRSTVAS